MIWRPSEHEEVTGHPWDERLARNAIDAIASDAEAAQADGFWPGHPLDDVAEHDRFSSLYLGSAGTIGASGAWALPPRPLPRWKWPSISTE